MELYSPNQHIQQSSYIWTLSKYTYRKHFETICISVIIYWEIHVSTAQPTHDIHMWRSTVLTLTTQVLWSPFDEHVMFITLLSEVSNGRAQTLAVSPAVTPATSDTLYYQQTQGQLLHINSNSNYTSISHSNSTTNAIPNYNYKIPITYRNNTMWTEQPYTYQCIKNNLYFIAPLFNYAHYGTKWQTNMQWTTFYIVLIIWIE